MLLGSAPDPRIQQEFVDLANQLHNMHHDRARLCLTYDEPLSHLVFDHILQMHGFLFWFVIIENFIMRFTISINVFRRYMQAQI